MPPRRRKLPFRLRLLRLYYRIIHFRSPLKLRASIVRLRHDHPRPWLCLLQLFNPFPTWLYPVPEPVPAKQMLGNVSLMMARRNHIVTLRNIPVWRSRDTPLRSLYRLYESMASGEYAPMGQETEYFWYQNRNRWDLHRIEDPSDPDPIRYAILACLAEELVSAFNWRLGLGMRRNHKHILREADEDPYPAYAPVIGPSWTKDVPPISREDLLDLPRGFVNGEGKLVLEENGKSEIFARRNIVTNVGWLYTI
ncbi:hypothetical protein EMCG_01497 [[Emmonsia] crescens]|uniref:Uncharacterized protein n=1 Tax=[Emmonsia] crescens TaxID=73230 RepID=A0A0G2J2J1_9EURO|nr:hypothetical protein EMCG_01497 [Emmonsia crescens UAMH 3008]